MITDKEYKELNRIATMKSYRLRDRGDMETRNADMEDFIIIPIWEIKEVVISAYKLGKGYNGKII